MKSEINPVVAAVIIAVVALVIVGVVYFKSAGTVYTKDSVSGKGIQFSPPKDK